MHRFWKILAIVIAVYFLIVWKLLGAEVPIKRNIAWNEAVQTYRDMPWEALEKDLLVIQDFLKRYESKVELSIISASAVEAMKRAELKLAEIERQAKEMRKRIAEIREEVVK